MLFIAIGIVVFVIIYVIFLYNRVKSWSIRVEEAFAAIETYLEERFDLLTNLAETAMAEADIEVGIYKDIVDGRSFLRTAATLDEKVRASMKVEAQMPMFFRAF